MKVRIKIAGPDRGTVPLEFVASAIAQAQAKVVVATPARDSDGLDSRGPAVHPLIRRDSLVAARRLLLSEAQRGRLRVCDSTGIEGTVTDLASVAERDGLTCFKPLDDEIRDAIAAGSIEPDPGSGAWTYRGPPIELEPDSDATLVAALHTTPGWLAAWGLDRGFEFAVEFSGSVMTSANGWGGVDRPIEDPEITSGSTSEDENKQEATRERRARRLRRFRELGGDLRAIGDSWRVQGNRGALAQLAREEQAMGSPMSNDDSDVKRDLVAAIRDEIGS